MKKIKGSMYIEAHTRPWLSGLERDPGQEGEDGEPEGGVEGWDGWDLEERPEDKSEGGRDQDSQKKERRRRARGFGPSTIVGSMGLSEHDDVGWWCGGDEIRVCIQFLSPTITTH